MLLFSPDGRAEFVGVADEQLILWWLVFVSVGCQSQILDDVARKTSTHFQLPCASARKVLCSDHGLLIGREVRVSNHGESNNLVPILVV